jgi:septal ring factor EnvC (AmiA/AmiB activator)
MGFETLEVAMALSDADILKVKKHLHIDPYNRIIDARIKAVEENADRAAELAASLTAVNTAEAAIDNYVANSADEFVEAEGAKFDYDRHIRRLKEKYDKEVKNLARIIGIDFKPKSTGWQRR